MSEEWIQKMRKQLGGYEQKAPEGLLNDVMTKMTEKGLSSSPVQTNRTPKSVIVLWKYAASIAAVLILLFAWYYNPNNTQTQNKTFNNHEMVTEATTTDSPDTHTTKQEVKVRPEQLNKQKSAIVQTSQLSINRENKEYTESEEKIEIKEDVSHLSQPTDQTPTTEKTVSESKQQAPGTRKKESKKSYLAIPAKKYRSSWTAGGYVSGGLNYLSKSSRGMMLASANPYGSYDNNMEGNHSNSYLSGKELKTKVKHHQPLKVGVSFKYSLNDRWSLQSGLTYSYLSSDITTSENRQTYQTSQKLHFIGLPVAVAYNLWKYKKLSVYVSGGGEIEKMIEGKTSTDHLVEKKRKNTTQKEIDEKPWQFSASLGGGIAYHLAQRLSIYAEPSVNYYFDNHSKVKSIYQDKPFNFNMVVGVRFQLK